MPTKIRPMDYTRKEVEMQIEFGEKDAKQFIDHYNSKTTQRVNHPHVGASRYDCSVKKRYMNPERQLRHEKECNIKPLK